jgi:hypothetical protein
MRGAWPRGRGRVGRHTRANNPERLWGRWTRSCHEGSGNGFPKENGYSSKRDRRPDSGMDRKAKENADVIYSGSEAMMSDFTDAMGDQLTASVAEPLYLRPAAMLAAFA